MRNSRLEGVKFGLFDNCGRQIATGCTNCNGEIDFEGLPMGRYTLKQLTRHGDFDGEMQCREVCIDRNGRCHTVEFENVMLLGGIRVQLSGRSERCDFRDSRRNRDCGCGCSSQGGTNRRERTEGSFSSFSEASPEGECGSSMRSGW